MYNLWEIVASNTVVATIMAVVAALLGRIWRNAAAVHLLWVIVLLKLFTPALVTTDLPFAVTFTSSVAGDHFSKEILNSPVSDNAEETAPVAVPNVRGLVAAGDQQRTLWNRFTETARRQPRSIFTVVASMWICGACCTAAVYAVRIRRFAASSATSRRRPQRSARWPPSFRAGWG